MVYWEGGSLSSNGPHLSLQDFYPVRHFQAATPLSCHCLLTREFERVGLLRYKAMLDPQQWKEAYFVLQKSNLFICPLNDGAAEDIINLKRLQELSQSTLR